MSILDRMLEGSDAPDCPEPDCNGKGVYLPPNWTDKSRRKLICEYRCNKCGHKFVVEYNTK